MKLSPRSEAEKIEHLIEYYKIFNGNKEWTKVLNHQLPLLVAAKKDCVVGIYKAIISTYTKKGGIPCIEELGRRKYGKEKQQLKRETISKYLKGMVEGMMQIISLDFLSSNETVGIFAYLNRLRGTNTAFHFREINRCLKNIDSNIHNVHSYSIMRNRYFHPLYDNRTSEANEMLGKTIKEYKIHSYIETFKLHLQSLELKLAKGVKVSSFPHITSIIADSVANNFFDNLLLKLYTNLADILNKESIESRAVISFAKEFPSAIMQTDNTRGKPKIPDYDAAYLYNLLTNSLIRLQRSGNQECQLATVILNDACITTPAVLVDGHIAHEYFFNIIQQRTEIGLSSNKYPLEDMINFVDEHIDLVHKDRKEHSEILTKKYIYLRYGDTTSAYNIGMNSADSIVDKTLYGCFELACVFCQNIPKEEFYKQCRNFEKLLEDGKTENNSLHIQGYFSFVEELRELKKLDIKASKLHLLDKEEMTPLYEAGMERIQTYPSYISMKTWLLDLYRDRIEKKGNP